VNGSGSTWYSNDRWIVIELASRRSLRCTPDLATYFDASGQTHMSSSVMRKTARELLARGLAVIGEPDSGSLRVSLTEQGKRVRTQWYHPQGKSRMFPYPGLINPPPHHRPLHLILHWVGDPEVDQLPVDAGEWVHELRRDGLMVQSSTGVSALTGAGVALLGVWDRAGCRCEF
jgi:hypothetical protein